MPDLDIALKATPAKVPILPGNPTGVWHYQGQVIKGDQASLINLERSYLGPIIRTHTGQKVRIRFTNDIAGRKRLWPFPNGFQPLDDIGPQMP
jgi:hypothetical protein